MAKRVDPVLKVLKATRRLLGSAKRWTKKLWARDKAGFDVPVNSKAATCWCLIGATSRVTGGRAPLYDVTDLLSREAKTDSLTAWNDNPRRTHAQVVRLLDRTIARREKALAA